MARPWGLAALALAALLACQALCAQAVRLSVELSRGALRRGDLLVIRVRALAGGSPLPRAVVGVEIRDPSNSPVLLEINQTDEGGVATFRVRVGEAWPAGRYTVWAAISGTAVKATAHFFVVGAGGGAEERVISVTDANGRPLANATVRVAGGARELVVRTDRSGAAVVNVTEGLYQVEVEWMGVVVFSGSVSVAGRVVSVSCAVYQVTVYVTEMFTGRPLEGVLVLLRLPSGAIVSGKTDSEGRAVLPQVPRGVHELRVGGKSLRVSVSGNVDVAVELEPLWTYFLPILLVIVAASVIYVIRASRAAGKERR